MVGICARGTPVVFSWLRFLVTVHYYRGEEITQNSPRNRYGNCALLTLLTLLRAAKFSPLSVAISPRKQSRAAKCILEDIRCHYSNDGISDTGAGRLYSFAQPITRPVRIRAYSKTFFTRGTTQRHSQHALPIGKMLNQIIKIPMQLRMMKE